LWTVGGLSGFIKNEMRRHYAQLCGRPGAMHSAFNQFAAFTGSGVPDPHLVYLEGALMVD